MTPAHDFPKALIAFLRKDERAMLETMRGMWEPSDGTSLKLLRRLAVERREVQQQLSMMLHCAREGM